MAERARASIASRTAALLSTFALSLLFTACQETDQLGGGGSSIAVQPRSLSLGRVFLGSSARATFTLAAPGELSVRYSTGLEGDVFGYQVGPAVGRLGANEAVEMIVVFRPGRAGTAEARVVISSDATRTATATVELVATGVEPPDCEDGNGCTTDSFDLDAGRCVHDANRAPCDDFNDCTDADQCVEGVCLGRGRSCDDQDVCTDDLCDPRQGCVHVPTLSCGDDNPCTADLCDPVVGCTHVALDDGTPCDDLQQCTIGDICLSGECVGVAVPDGSACDDGNPCSKQDQCIQGTCRDPTYIEPAVGEVKFATDVGPLAEGASQNPIVDRDGTVFVGVEDGVVAVDHCGDITWANHTLGAPRQGAAVSLPGILTVPIGARVVDLDTVTGDPIRELDLSALFPAVTTASTATTTVRVLDLALRGSGAIVVSLVRETRPLDATAGPDRVAREGLLAEIDRFHTAYSVFRALGAAHASRLAIDADESVLAIVRSGAPDKGLAGERVVRFGLGGLPETTWSLSPVPARHTELAFASNGDVLWTAGLLSIARDGSLLSLLEPDAGLDQDEHGSPVTSGGRVAIIRRGEGAFAQLRALGFARPAELVVLELATGAVAWSAPLDAGATRMSPAVDARGNLFVTTSDGVLHAFDGTGAPLFETELPLAREGLEDVALTLTPEAILVGIADGRVFGVKSTSSISGSSWPRHRRDNLSTGHR